MTVPCTAVLRVRVYLCILREGVDHGGQSCGGLDISVVQVRQDLAFTKPQGGEREERVLKRGVFVGGHCFS